MSTHVHRSIDRRAVLSKAAEMRKSALDNVGSEVAGTLLAPATGAIGGSAIGALAGGILAGIKGKSIARGAGAGAGLGAMVGGPAAHLANLGGVLAGVFRKRRTREEQQKHDSKSHWGNFIPGVASYNYTKRMGRVLSGVGEPDKEKKAAEAAFAEGFCKAAEAAGVDPVALYKAAAPWGFLGGLAGRALGAARAARGAVQAKGLIGATRQGLSAAGGAIARGGQQAAGYGRRYLELLRGGNANVRGAFGMGRGDLASMGKLKGYAQTYAEGLRGGMGADAASELRKALAARGATAVGVLGGAKALSGSSATANQGTPGAAAQDVGHNLTGIGQ